MSGVKPSGTFPPFFIKLIGKIVFVDFPTGGWKNLLQCV